MVQRPSVLRSSLSLDYSGRDVYLKGSSPESCLVDQAGELPSTLPGDIDTGAPVGDVTAGADHTCALSTDGQLKCWGRGTSGQLGYGDFDNRLAPPAADVDLDGVSAYWITAGAEHTCALRSNGTVRSSNNGTSSGAVYVFQ